MQSPSNPLIRLWQLFNKRSVKSSDSDLRGSQYPLGVGSTQRRAISLAIPEVPVRPICGSLQLSYELLEILTWSYEASHTAWRWAEDAFQQIDGDVGSWQVAGVMEEDAEGEKSRAKLNPEIKAIADDLSIRMSGKDYVIGGNRLLRAAFEAPSLGDSFMELAISKEGIGRNDWGISKTQYLPAMSIFVDTDERGEEIGYSQREKAQPGKDDIHFDLWKILHFSFRRRGLYGNSVFGPPSLETWRKLKQASADLEESCRAAGLSPWLHIMPSDKDEKYKQAYRQEVENLRQDGIITDLYLLNSGDLKKASTGNSEIDSQIKNIIQLRQQMVIPGVPLWNIPGLGQDKGGKDLSGQPAMTYARLIATLRSVIGEQIRWALSVEIVLKKGFDFWLSEGRDFDITWGSWFVTGFEKGIMDQGEESKPSNQPDDSKEEDATERYAGRV